MDSAAAAPAVTPPPAATPAAAASEDKTAAILSYITLIGFIAAIVINSNKKTKLGAFHLRQAMGIFLTIIAAGIGQFVLVFIPILGWLAILGLWIAVIAMLVMGLISAIQGQMKPLPVLGAMYQKWFGTAFD